VTGGPAAYSFGICGTTGPDPRYNPGVVLREPTAQAIVRLLNEGPRSEPDLRCLVPPLAACIHACGSRAGTAAGPGNASSRGPRTASPQEPLPFAEALERVVGLRAVVRREGRDLWHIGFPLLTAGDEDELRCRLEPFARGLANLLLGAREAVDRALTSISWGRPLPEVRFAVVGCLALDWAALAFLGQAGITHPGIKYPDGGQFTILGRERTSFSPPKLYCSSHTARGGAYSFTGFGDNSGPRHGLPDVLWSLESVARRAAPDLPEETGRAVSGIVREQRTAVLDAAGAELEGTGTGGPMGQAVRALLAAAGCVSEDGPQVLVLKAGHWPALRAAAGEAMNLVGPWILANRQDIADAAAGTSPARNGVEASMFFVELWHDVFGAANQIMAEEGWLFDPVPPGPGQARYLSWCAENTVYDSFREWALGEGQYPSPSVRS